MRISSFYSLAPFSTGVNFSNNNDSLDDFDQFFSISRKNNYHSSTPCNQRHNSHTTCETTMSSSNSPSASPATSRRNNRNRSMRKGGGGGHRSRGNNLTNATSNSHIASNNSLQDVGRTSSIDNHGQHHSQTQNGSVEKYQARIHQIENELRERGEQILKLRKENREVQARADEANDALAMEKATHEKLMADLQQRTKRKIDAAKRDTQMELDESQEMIAELSEQVQQLQIDAQKEKVNADKYKDEAEKINERFQVTSTQLVDMSAQCRKLTESAMNRQKDNQQSLEQQRQESVQSEELIQSCKLVSFFACSNSNCNS